jgi:hypothetical protein
MFGGKMPAASAAAIISVLSFTSLPAIAHHSFAMFDQTQTVTMTGTVTRFDWLNPHTWLYVAAVDAGGNEVTWGFEGSSPAGLASTGWTAETVKPGDRITVGFHPLKDGTNGGQIRTVTLPDGSEMCNGAECRATAGVED